MTTSPSEVWQVLTALSIMGACLFVGIIVGALWQARRRRAAPFREPPREVMMCWGGPKHGRFFVVAATSRELTFPVLLEMPLAYRADQDFGALARAPKIGRYRYIRWGRRYDGVALFRPER